MLRSVCVMSVLLASMGIGNFASAAHAIGDRAAPLFTRGTIDEPVWRQFLSQARTGWSSAKQRLAGVEMSTVFRTGFSRLTPGNGAAKELPETKGRYCVAKNGTNRLAVESFSNEDEISAVNERYSFSVGKSAEGGAAQLLNAKLLDGSESPNLPASIALRQEALQAQWSAWWVPLDFIIGNDDFTLVTCQNIPPETIGEIVRVAYQYHGEDLREPPCRRDCIYWADLVPSEDWMVLRSGVNGLPTDGLPEDITAVRCECVVDYREATDGHLFPKTVRLEYVDETTGRVIEFRESEFGPPEPCRRDDKEFFLPFYGLSEASLEPAAVVNRWRLRSVVIAVAMLAAAVLLRLRYRGRKRESVRM